MSRDATLRFDEIGAWSEIKLEIIKKYAKAYSTILARQQRLRHAYIDAFAGGGVHVSRERRELVPGSPLNALWIEPPFDAYYLIDLDGDKVEQLKRLSGIRERKEVYILHGDCNSLLLEEIFPRVRYEDFWRALCLLDPYGLHLDWKVLEAAGKSGVIEIFLNFPIMDINRNALWRHPKKVGEVNTRRMTRFWGDESWRKIAYKKHPQQTLFGGREMMKVGNEEVAAAFRQRLKEVAGFRYVPEPIPMYNSKGAVVYYLFFAGPNRVGANIARDIFSKYRASGG